MAIQGKSVSQFEDQIANGAASRDTSIDTNIGPIRDLFISPVAEVLRDVHNNVVYFSQLISMRNAERFNPEDLDAFVFNENIVRWSGAPSYAVATFSRLLPPTADIQIPTNFPLSTSVDPRTGRTVNFRTIESKTMYGPGTTPASSYYNPTSERYEIDVAVASVGYGEDTMVGPYTITQFRRSFPDFEYVTNKSATTSGRGIETNSDLAVRYQTRITGNQEATPNGLKSFSLNMMSSISDVYVVYGSDTNLTRDVSDSGAVDVWLKASAPVTSTYDTRYPGVRVLVPVAQQPVVTITSVSSGATYYTEGVDYEIVTGEGVYAYSDRGSDGIRFLTGGAAPSVGEPLSISYQYNAIINIATAIYKQSDYYVMGSDVLFRWAQKKNIVIEAALKISSGNPNAVLSAVRSRVTNYINSLKLGDDVEEFDIDAQVATVVGVDNWVYVTLAVKGSLGVGDIPVGPMEYAFLEDSDLIISVV